MAKYWNVAAVADDLETTPDAFAVWAGRSGGQEFVTGFSSLFGQICGDLALACGAFGGVFICGSAALAWHRFADEHAFSKAFRDKGPLSERMARVPVDMIALRHSALIGLSHVPLV